MAGLDEDSFHAIRSLAACHGCRHCDFAASTLPDQRRSVEFLRLSSRELEKQRLIGGDPKFRKFGRRFMYAVSGLDAWADQRNYQAKSDPEHAERHAGDYRAGR